MSAVYTKLRNRAFIFIEGKDRFPFLQGFITQDIYSLLTQPMIYGCLLTSQGKFLFDFFISEDGDRLCIECEGGERAKDLLAKLSLYKLRADVTLKKRDRIGVWQIFRGDSHHGLPDPRHPECGRRSYIKPSDLTPVSFKVWEDHRIRHEIPDGSRDLIPEKSYIHEGRLDDLNGVSYKKGCYVGQELVSRMHHRGLTKKILRCVSVKDAPEEAEIRSSCGDIGLALVKTTED